MKKVVYRDEGAACLVGAAFMASLCALVWLLFLAVKNENAPEWVWLIPISISAGLFSLAVLFLFYLVGVKAVITDDYLVRMRFGRKTEIKKGDILAIVDMSMTRGRFYVVYPKGYDAEAMAKQCSVYTDVVARTMAIQRDRRLLVFAKNKKTSELLNKFGYRVTMTVE